MEQTLHSSSGTFSIPGTGAATPALNLPADSSCLPFITVVLPTWREEAYIADCLRSVLSQDYPLHRMEILVADGMSTDRTREIVAQFAADYPQIRLVDNPDRLQASGLNKAILVSRGEYIVRLDAHAEYGSSYIRSCIETLQKTQADNVGGPQQTRARSFFQRMVAAALDSKLGSGGAAYRHSGSDRYVDTVFLGAFRRQILQRVGLYDPGAITNEDAEINQRIIASGGKIYLSSSIECYYYPRDSVRSLAVQYFRYGRGRARTVLKHGSIMRISSFIPFLFVCGVLGLLSLGLVLKPALWLAVGSLALYATALVAESVRMALKHHWACAFVLPLIFATTHLSHAAGVAWGLLYYSRDPDWQRLAPPLLIN